MTSSSVWSRDRLPQLSRVALAIAVVLCAGVIAGGVVIGADKGSARVMQGLAIGLDPRP